MTKTKTKARIKEKLATKGDKENRLIVFAIALLIFLVAAYVAIQALSGNEDNSANDRQSNSSLVIDENTKTETHVRCLSRNGIASDVLYIYGQDCSYSQENTPWVNELIAEGYSIFMLDTADTNLMLAAYNCLYGIASFEGTPEYVCIKTNKTHLGSFSLKSEIIAFIESCKLD